MGLRDLAAVLAGASAGAQERSLVWPWPQDMMRYNGRSYLLSNQSYGPNEDARLTGERQALTSNGVVYGIFRARADLFSQARFQWQKFNSGRPGDLFGNADLGILEHPWPGGTTRSLLGVLEVDGGGDPFVDPAGSYKIRINRQAPGIAIGYSTSGAPAPTADEVAAAVWAKTLP